MRIIKVGEDVVRLETITTCGICGTEFAYTKGDLWHGVISSGLDDVSNYIVKCPICRNYMDTGIYPDYTPNCSK